uniref:Pentatricopeptide repeat-containing protein n=1 Tax=Ananas comosus var. bracteatus TaxID=296719 RepID=A0A6V7P5R9_ANACO|nr:unnamed protein product [Ananas comosus var. bracteatus]
MLFSPCVSTPPHLRKLTARLRSPLHLLLVSSLSCDPPHLPFAMAPLAPRRGEVQAYGIKSCLLDDSSDVISWNKAISEYVKNGQSDFALDCFMEMRKLNVGYDNVTFVVVLSAIAGTEYFDLSEQLHGIAIKSMLWNYAEFLLTSTVTHFCPKMDLTMDSFVLTALIDAYSKMGCMDEAKLLYMDCFDIASGNALVAGYVAIGDNHEALELFSSIVRTGQLPNHFTLATALKACSSLLPLNKGNKFILRQ